MNLPFAHMWTKLKVSFVLVACSATISVQASSMPSHAHFLQSRSTGMDSQALSAAQVSMVMDIVAGCGAPASANLLSLQTTNGTGFTISGCTTI